MQSAMVGNSQLLSKQAIVATKRSESPRPAGGAHNASSIDLDEVIFLRLPEVKAVTGLSKTSLYALIRENSFPAPVRLGPRAVAGVRSEIRQWAVERVHASRPAAWLGRADSCEPSLLEPRCASGLRWYCSPRPWLIEYPENRPTTASSLHAASGTLRDYMQRPPCYASDEQA